MLRQKAFVKVTSKGSVNKVVKEHYLRQDIPCGVIGCKECEPLLVSLNETATSPAILLDPLHQMKANRLFPGFPLLLLPDTNILLHHLDVLETDLFSDVVILQTVLDEVKGNSAAVYRRIRSLIAQPSKRFFVFSNEHRKETFVEKIAGESDNDRNDRCIRRSASWYQEHLKAASLDLKVILLTNDVANAKFAQGEGINVFSLKAFCDGFSGEKGFDAVMDMLESAKDFVSNEEKTALKYDEYFSAGLLEAGIASGKFVKGTIQISPYNSKSATVSAEIAGVSSTIHIDGLERLNRAMQGDLAVIEILPREQWTKQGAVQAEVTTEETTEKPEEELVSFPAIEHIPDEPVTMTSAEPCGKVVGIIRRSLRTICGSIDRKTIKENANAQNVLVVPLDRRMPRIRIRTRNAQTLANHRLVVTVDGWERTSRYPHGHLVRSLGVAGERATETEVILLEHDVAYADFTPQVMACLPSADWRPSPEDYAVREDFRHLDICSVDPPGCTDIDDALHAIPLPNGNIEVGVHIADVTHFVKADTPLDLEASSRSTTVYLVDRRIDMLPGLLGTNLCSLKCNVERFAFSCIWELTPDAKIVSTRFCKSVIASKASFTYDEAQSRLEKGNPDDALSQSLHLLNALAKQLKARRIAAGALTLASPEVRFTLETETQNPVDVVLKEMKDANSMVEEFMLLANISVATQLYQHFPETAVLRRHPSPPAENFAALNKALQARGLEPLKVDSSRALADSLDHVSIPEDSYFNRLVRIMTTRCMYQAQYFASGSVSYESFWHYGLACPIYTHFTSPIRRYADVLVHRLLAASIQASNAGSSTISWDKQRLEDICNSTIYLSMLLNLFL